MQDISQIIERRQAWAPALSADEIAAAIDAALLTEAMAHNPPPSVYRGKHRDYRCTVDGCDRQGVSKGYCHAHYIRMSEGRDMNAPIRNRGRGTKCKVCGKSMGGKGGWGMCSNHYKTRRLAVIKGAVVEFFGRSCRRCNQAFPLPVFDFHHVGDKDASVASLMNNASPRQIAAEVVKCVLLCANCHRIEHSAIPTETIQ